MPINFLQSKHDAPLQWAILRWLMVYVCVLFCISSCQTPTACTCDPIPKPEAGLPLRGITWQLIAVRTTETTVAIEPHSITADRDFAKPVFWLRFADGTATGIWNCNNAGFSFTADSVQGMLESSVLWSTKIACTAHPIEHMLRSSKGSPAFFGEKAFYHTSDDKLFIRYDGHSKTAEFVRVK